MFSPLRTSSWHFVRLQFSVLAVTAGLPWWSIEWFFDHVVTMSFVITCRLKASLLNIKHCLLLGAAFICNAIHHPSIIVYLSESVSLLKISIGEKKERKKNVNNSVCVSKTVSQIKKLFKAGFTLMQLQTFACDSQRIPVQIACDVCAVRIQPYSFYG